MAMVSVWRKAVRLARALGWAAVIVTLGPAAVGADGPGSRPPAGIDFDRQVRPILAENCFACHGPDEAKRKGRLRLDRNDPALQAREVIVPGRAAESLLVERIAADDPEFRMPPPRTGKRLGPEQVELLRAWINGGASWSAHWSLVAPRRAEPPPIRQTGWVRNAIDRFIAARLESEGLEPSPEADRATLVRRLALDLTGLPPALAEVDDFLSDSSPAAYERLVDRLLASPRCGERLALDWLDAARFADTHGYHRDAGRDMTRWRDGVIAAFNRNQSFDAFTIEQLAGDLLPGASLEQKVASGFHRNHMINIETGAVPEEYLTAYVVDRVNTTGTIWLGLTLGCAQCHDHKFDPISRKEYYQLYAFFNNVPENGIDGASGNAPPLLRLATPVQERELARLTTAIARQKKAAARPGESVGTQQGTGDELAALEKARAELERQVPTAMVMSERPRRSSTFELVRGQYDRPGAAVEPALPAALPPLPPGAPSNRLGLARWLVDRANPLTPRVVVNRYWQMLFGTGLVATADDFGTQGEFPSHPELLDWLAVEFIESGWDVKRLLRLIVTSATYCQASAVTPELARRDPENRLLARGPRFRLAAELIRDQALSVAGLLDGRIGGPSVFPYQPPGLWEELCARLDSAKFSAQTYTPSHGADLYRRSMYTFWKRTSPPPGLLAFDAPDRETCTVRRARTSTPLQALVLLNDPTYVEAARKLAERVMIGARTDDERIALAFRLATSRPPRPAERETLGILLDAQRAVYRHDRREARALLAVGEAPRDDQLDAAELATWTIVAGVILNLDEVITRG